MKRVTPDKGFRPDTLPETATIGMRADDGAVSLWLFDARNVVIGELVFTPEDGWEFALDIAAMSDRAAGITK